MNLVSTYVYPFVPPHLNLFILTCMEDRFLLELGQVKTRSSDIEIEQTLNGEDAEIEFIPLL